MQALTISPQLNPRPNYLLVHTPTELDLRELFTLGLTTKRDGNKIGHKGSGLKFALALIHRLGSQLIVRVGQHDLKSVSVTEVIRGQEHQIIRLEGSSAGQPCRIETHITDKAGADTWTEAWFALRELVQNALDEGGGWELVQDEGRYPDRGTCLLLSLTPPLLDAWNQRDNWMHPRHSEIIYEAPTCTGLYYHGFKVYPGEDWRWGYDVTGLIEREKLSEDRQLRNVNLDDLFKNIVKACPELPPDFYEAILCPEGNAGLPADVANLQQGVYCLIERSNRNPGGFRMLNLEAAIEKKYGPKVAYTTETNTDSPKHYFARSAGYAVAPVPHYTKGILLYSEHLIEAESVLPAVAARLAPVREIATESAERLKAALRITRKLKPPGCKVRVSKPKLANDRMDASAFAVREKNEVLLLEDFVSTASTEQIAEALVEEYVHLSSGESDGSISFEKALVKSIVRLIYPRRVAIEAL
jgi:hypothetical protein